MNENDYINATNLAKLRIALNVLKDVLPMNGTEESYVSEAMKLVSSLCADLEKQVIAR